jgi:hypothetical protein
MATITKPSGLQFTIRDEDLGKWVEQKRARARKQLAIGLGVASVFAVLISAAGQLAPASPSAVVYGQTIH